MPASQLAGVKSVQKAAFEAAKRTLPGSPYIADSVAFVRGVTAGSSIPDAAWSAAGKQPMREIERRGVDLGAVARGREKAPEPGK